MVDFCFNSFNRSAYLGVDPHLPEQIAAAAAAGFRLFGPDRYSIEAWMASGRSLQELSDLLQAHGMRCWEIAAGLFLQSPADAAADARHVAAMAEVLHPDWIQINVGVADSAAVRSSFAEVCEIVTSTGAKVAVEYLPTTPIDSIARTRSLVDHAGLDRAGILVDTWHHFRGPDTDSDLEALPLEYIAYLQFDDALPLISADLASEMLQRRTFPGEGEFDIRGFCRRLKAKGYEGTISVEVISAAWRDRDLGEFARRAYDSSGRFWS